MMKKTLLFFTVFLIFVFLSAEEVQVGEYEIEGVTITSFEEREAEPEPEPEKEPEKSEEQSPEAVEEEKEVNWCENPAENKWPEIFYIQPTFGIGTGLSKFRPTLTLDIDFLAAHFEKHNLYFGLDLDLRYVIFWEKIGDVPTLEFPVQANAVVEFVQKKGFLQSWNLWLSLGIDLIFYNELKKHYFWDGSYVYRYDENLSFKYFAAWGIGIDLLFERDVVMRLGIDGLGGKYPDFMVGFGYRF